MSRQLELYPRSQDELKELYRLVKPLTNCGMGLISGDYPPVDVYRTEDGVLLNFQVPGMDFEKLEISIDGKQIRLAGERKIDEDSGNCTLLRNERFHGHFERLLELPFFIDEEGIEADIENGELQIALQEVEESRSARFTSNRGSLTSADKNGSSLPYCDIYESTSSYMVIADMPGVEKDRFDIEFSGDTLTIIGKRKEVGLSAALLESPSNTYKRTFKLTREIDSEAISASLDNGTLSIELPKRKFGKVLMFSRLNLAE